MKTLICSGMTLAVDFLQGTIHSLRLGGKERIAAPSALFRLRLRDTEGNAYDFCATDATRVAETDTGAVYEDFGANGPSVTLFLCEKQGEATWRVSVTPPEGFLVEWVEYPRLILPHLVENNSEGTGGKLLYPFNEGVLVSDAERREQRSFRYREPCYPAYGGHCVFPNMIFSQMMAYLWEDGGLYMATHDAKRGVKSFNFYSTEKGLTPEIRVFCGKDYGKRYESDFDLIWAAVDGRWESAAERYRSWFESALPPKTMKIRENPALPEWYAKSPLVVTYPIRGWHDMDDMTPNSFYPYLNAMPTLNAIKEATDSQLMVLLMHWEGTAPWAPPYVWPPFGGEEPFNVFRRALSEQGDLLGVYCSGFSFSEQSNLIQSYNCREEYERDGLERGMAAGENGKVGYSDVCRGQRSGYDVCPASPVGRKLLDRAYAPLFEQKLDYVQILDQNHGGSQYFCYARDHGHPPAPGAWMTERMQELLSDWNSKAPETLFGCESAAAEPFLGNLLFSDNRFELCYRLGQPVPMYAYLYHEYLRNFMGNQCSTPFRDPSEDTLAYRVAYSFSVGDAMTLALRPDGELLSFWSQKDFSILPDKEKTLRLVANLTEFYKREGKDYLYAGRMIAPMPTECGSVTYCAQEGPLTLPKLHVSAWETESGERRQLLVNPHNEPVRCTVDGKEITVPALNAISLNI